MRKVKYLRIYKDENWDILDENIPPISKEEMQFEKELHDFLQSLIDTEQSLTEEFVSGSELRNHYRKHCLCGIPTRKSRKSNVYYDFDDINKYGNYENKISSEVNKTELVISYLGDTQVINNYFHKLFECYQSIYFTTSCGFENTHGPVNIGIHAFSTDKTKNYSSANTVNFLVLSRRKTVTMYPVDAHYLESKINNIIKKHNDIDIQLKFNND